MQNVGQRCLLTPGLSAVKSCHMTCKHWQFKHVIEPTHITQHTQGQASNPTCTCYKPNTLQHSCCCCYSYPCSASAVIQNTLASPTNPPTQPTPPHMLAALSPAAVTAAAAARPCAQARCCCGTAAGLSCPASLQSQPQQHVPQRLQGY